MQLEDLGFNAGGDYVSDPSAFGQFSPAEMGGFTPETFSPVAPSLGVGGLPNPPPSPQLGILDWLKLATAGVGAGGAIASAFGGGPSQAQRMSTPQAAALAQLQAAIAQQQALTQPLYAQGAGLLSAMAQGQIPPGISSFVDQLYGPQLQGLGSQAIEASRRAGFALPQDAFTGGPGGAVLGPGLAQLPGLKAQTLMDLVKSLMQPQQLSQQGLLGAFSPSNIPGGTIQQQPSIGQRIGTASGGIAGVLEALSRSGIGKPPGQPPSQPVGAPQPQSFSGLDYV